MSFILDALKKSESEHQRQAGPALFEVKVAPPRHRLAPWAVALGALLAVNLVVVGWMLTRGSSTAARKALQTPTVATETAPRSAATARSATAPSPSPVTPAPGSSGPGASPGGAPAGSSKAPVARTSTPANSPASDRPAASQSDAAAAAAEASDAGGSSAYDSNPADFAPAVEPAENAPTQNGGGSVVRASDGSLPSYREAASAPGADLPALRLDLHVYDARPDRRFVFLNMIKLRQGQSLPNGVRVERITPSGVVLAYGGKRFLLQRR